MLLSAGQLYDPSAKFVGEADIEVDVAFETVLDLEVLGTILSTLFHNDVKMFGEHTSLGYPMMSCGVSAL